MVDMILDMVFAVVFLAVPCLAAIYLAGFVFGKAETVAAVKTVGVAAYKALLGLARRIDRAVTAFVSDADNLDSVRAQIAEEANYVVAKLQDDVDHFEDRLTKYIDEIEVQLTHRLNAIEANLAQKIDRVEQLCEQMHDRLDEQRENVVEDGAAF